MERRPFCQCGPGVPGCPKCQKGAPEGASGTFGTARLGPARVQEAGDGQDRACSPAQQTKSGRATVPVAVRRSTAREGTAPQQCDALVAP